MSLARITFACAFTFAVQSARGALACGGDPNDHEPSRAQLMGGEAPATAPVRTRTIAPQVATERLGDGASPDREATFAREHAFGTGYLTVFEDRLDGFKLAPTSHHLLLAVDTVASSSPAERPFDSFAVTVLAHDGARFDWGVGQLELRDNDLIGAHTTALNIGFVRYHERLQLGGGMRLDIDAHLTANLVQETVAQSPLLRGIEDGLRACSTQSEIGLRLRLHLDAAVALSAFGINQDDPFHFTSGADCFGDGAVWSESSKVGGAVEVMLGRGLVMSAGITWATAAIGYDLEPWRHGVAAGGLYRDTNVEGTIALAWRQ